MYSFPWPGMDISIGTSSVLYADTGRYSAKYIFSTATWLGGTVNKDNSDGRPISVILSLRKDISLEQDFPCSFERKYIRIQILIIYLAFSRRNV